MGKKKELTYLRIFLLDKFKWNDAFLYNSQTSYMSQLLLLGKVAYGGGPIFKVVLEC